MQKFRSIEDMAGARILTSAGAEGFDRFLRHCARMLRLVPRAYPRGVFKFRNIEEAQAARKRPVHRISIDDEGSDGGLRHLSPAERLAMMWTLARQTWMFKEGLTDEPRLRRDVVHIVRGRR